jgi:hypothetical protein
LGINLCQHFSSVGEERRRNLVDSFYYINKFAKQVFGLWHIHILNLRHQLLTLS